MAGIIWIASYPKSGNTWVRLFIETTMRGLKKPLPINDRKSYTIGDSDYSLFRHCHGDNFSVEDYETTQNLRPRVHELLTTFSTENVLVKTHCALIEVFKVPQISLEHTAGAVYIVRNPLDVVDSLADHLGKTLDEAVEFMCSHLAAGAGVDGERVGEFYGSWSDHVYSWTAERNPALLVLRYEDLLAEPHLHFRRLLDFLRFDVSDNRLDELIRLSSIDNFKAQEAVEGFRERSQKSKSKRFFREGRSGRWQEILTKKQAQKIKKSHAAVMQHFGYI